MGEQLTPKAYYKVTILHAIVAALGLLFASLGCAFTQYRVHIHVNNKEKEEGKEDQQDVPYWVSGFVLGGLNVLLCLLSYNVYRLVTKGTYTESRKECAKERDGQYRFVLLIATIWGIGGAVFTGIFGVCSYESDETCYYVYTNFAANKGFAITLVVIHSLWFLVVLDLWSTTKGIQNKVGSIAVGTKLSSPPRSSSRVRSQRQTDNRPPRAAAPPQAPAAPRQAPTTPTNQPPNNCVSPPPAYEEAISSPFMIDCPPYVANANTQA